MLKNHIDDWLNRDVVDKSVNQIHSLHTIIATDKGLKRNENQDRVAMMSTHGKPENHFIAIAVADGMGGMRDGAECASLAIGVLFEALLERSGRLTEQSVASSVALANDEVYRFSNGRGGATLSVIVRNNKSEIITVNVGDSRIYAFEHGDIPRRLTVDDNLAEMVGGYGKELLQFIGMGDGLRAHVNLIQTHENLMITTDGIHFLKEEMLNEVVSFAPTNRAVVERLSALARWCGSPDNASIVVFDPDSFDEKGANEVDSALSVVDIWDSFSSMRLLLPHPNGTGFEKRNAHEKSFFLKSDKRNAGQGGKYSEANRAARKRIRSALKKSSQKAKPIGDVQFEIDIGDDAGKQRDND